MNQFLIFFAFFRWTKGSACLALRVRFALAFPHLKKAGHFRPGARCISVLLHFRPTIENNYGMSLWNSTFFLRKKPPARQKLFFSVVTLKGVMILDCVCMCLEVDHVIKMCTNMAGQLIPWRRSRENDLLKKSVQISSWGFIFELEERWLANFGLKTWAILRLQQGKLLFLLFARTTYIRLLIYLKTIYGQKMKEIDFSTLATRCSIFPDRRS